MFFSLTTIFQFHYHFLKFLFEKVGLNKIEVHFTIANNKSAKVAEKLGFKIEGILRQCVWRQGLIEDLVIAGMLRKEWDEKKSALLNI
jgi:RimJ/RimL family protein N-acetyltransferase